MSRAGAAALMVLLAACSPDTEPPPAATSTTSTTAATTSTSAVTTSTAEVPATTVAEVPEVVLATTRAATFSVRGLDCRKAQIGTAFLVAPDLLATNAHVVAGIEVPILSVDNEEVSSRVVAFDPVSDLAILRIAQDLGEPMSLGEATVGAAVDSSRASFRKCSCATVRDDRLRTPRWSD